MEMYFPGYVWLTYSDETGAFQIHNTECALANSKALDGLFTLRSVIPNPDTDTLNVSYKILYAKTLGWVVFVCGNTYL